MEHNPDSTYLARCDMVDADAGLGISGPAVLCVDYVVRAGDCIAVKTADFVDCDSTAEVRKVLALLTGTLDPGGCPADTTDHLRYRSRGEVLCLGTPPC